jgi:hypothetical protein
MKIIFYLILQHIEGNMVTFENNESDEFDTIILSTGYNIELKYLSDSIRTKIYSDQKQTKLNVNIAN